MAVDTLLPYDAVPDNQVEDKAIIDVDDTINDRYQYDHSILNDIDPYLG